MKRQINTETPFAKILKIWRSLELKSLRNAKLTLTKLIREFFNSLESSLIQLQSSLIQLRSARIELDTSPIEL